MVMDDDKVSYFEMLEWIGEDIDLDTGHGETFTAAIGRAMDTYRGIAEKDPEEAVIVYTAIAKHILENEDITDFDREFIRKYYKNPAVNLETIETVAGGEDTAALRRDIQEVLKHL